MDRQRVWYVTKKKQTPEKCPYVPERPKAEMKNKKGHNSKRETEH
jgi:hypothetical protein